jgi:exodeoxyribonuclease VII small subunit
MKRMKDTNTPIDSYESLYARLQVIVAALEAGELPLEQSLALYEEGVAAAAACQRILDEAALRVRELHGGASALEE